LVGGRQGLRTYSCENRKDEAPEIEELEPVREAASSGVERR